MQHLVARSARAIEDALLHATPHALRLHLAWGEALPGETAHAVLCLDAGGAVLGANSAARQMLPALAGLAHGGVHAGDLFALPWQHLFDLAGRDAPSLVPLWSGLLIAVQAVRPGAPAASPAPATPRLPLKALEERLIQQAVRDASGNVAEAARALGLSRATLYRRLAATRGASVARR